MASCPTIKIFNLIAFSTWLELLEMDVVPTVIDDGLLMETVYEQGPKGEAGKFCKAEGVAPAEVHELCLEYKNILVIDGLWEFVNLTKLQLCNNIIEKIQGLELLVNLVWLDLSFNNIHFIEGLDTLVNLEDLTLYNNKITCLENMDNLLKLHVLSMGNNDLRDLENLRYLRRFHNLRSLNLFYNPVCYDPQYKVFVGAFLPEVVFLDYRLLEEEHREKGAEMYQLPVLKLIEKEAKERKHRGKDLAKSQTEKAHIDAYVENLDGPLLFKNLYEEDREGNLLSKVKGAADLIAEFKHRFVPVCHQIFNLGMEEKTARDAEVALFWECFNEAMEEDRKQGMNATSTFKEEQKAIFEKMRLESDPVKLEDMVKAYHVRVTELWDDLVGAEMHLVDELDEIVERFELSLQDMASNFIEHIQELMSKLREYEGFHNEKLTEVATAQLESMARGEFDESMSTELVDILSDKDSTLSAIATSHDLHLLKIDLREDKIVNGITTWKTNLIKDIRKSLWERNRTRMTEICHFIDQARDDVDNLEMTP